MSWAGDVVDTSRDPDLALIRLPQPKCATPLQFSSGRVAVGQSVWTIGHPARGSRWSLAGGTVSAIQHSSEQFPGSIQMDVAVNPGNSGGPLLDSDGRVIGVVFARGERTETGRHIDGMGYAVPARIALEFLERQTELAQRPTPSR